MAGHKIGRHTSGQAREDERDVAFEIHHCTNPACDLRYPVSRDDRISLDPGSKPAQSPAKCLRCAAPVKIDFAGRTDPAPPLPDASMRPTLPPLEGVLDNLRSAFNVGSIFRIADGAGLHKLHLCGYTATPEHPKVAKTALGAENAIDWHYEPNALRTLERLKAAGRKVVALEAAPGALSLFQATSLLPLHEPLALIAGNEITGIDPRLLDATDWLLRIPMTGIKGSLNVAVAFGIAVYWLQGIRIQAHSSATQNRTAQYSRELNIPRRK